MCSADVDDVDQHKGETHPDDASSPTEDSAAPDSDPSSTQPSQ